MNSLITVGKKTHSAPALTTVSGFYNTKKKNIPRTGYSWWSLDEFAIEMLNYGLALLRGFHPEKPDRVKINPSREALFAFGWSMPELHKLHVIDNRKCAQDTMGHHARPQSDLANPTPRLVPLASRRMRVEMTWPKDLSMLSSSCSSIDTGRLEM